jgi:hypothetical protein
MASEVKDWISGAVLEMEGSASRDECKVKGDTAVGCAVDGDRTLPAEVGEVTSVGERGRDTGLTIVG